MVTRTRTAGRRTHRPTPPYLAHTTHETHPPPLLPRQYIGRNSYLHLSKLLLSLHAFWYRRGFFEFFTWCRMGASASFQMARPTPLPYPITHEIWPSPLLPSQYIGRNSYLHISKLLLSLHSGTGEAFLARLKFFLHGAG
jgi:hypothetical protein